MFDSKEDIICNCEYICVISMISIVTIPCDDIALVTISFGVIISGHHANDISLARQSSNYHS